MNIAQIDRYLIIFENIEKDLYHHKVAYVSKADFNFVTKPLRAALLGQGMYLTAQGIVNKSGTYRSETVIISRLARYLPGDFDCISLGLKESLALNIVATTVDTYILKYCNKSRWCNTGSVDHEDWVDTLCDYKQSNETALLKVYYSYIKILTKRCLCIEDNKEGMDLSSLNGITYRADEIYQVLESDIYNYNEKHLNRLLESNGQSDEILQGAVRARRYSYEFLFMAATCFSILKPLYLQLRLGSPNFCMQILLDRGGECNETYESAHEFLEAEINQCCNHFVHQKHEYLIFRRTYAKIGIFARWTHHGFPVLLSSCKLKRGKIIFNTSKYDKVSTSIPNQLSKKNLEKIKTASCLPILFPNNAPKKNYSTADCLSITLPIKSNMFLRDKNVGFEIKHRQSPFHSNCMMTTYYAYFTQRLVTEEQSRIKELHLLLKNQYMKALQELGVTKHTATEEQQHKAHLISALRFALDIAPVPREISIGKGYLESELISLLCNHASLKIFAVFLQDALVETSPYHNIIFYKDEHNIYLHYKKYWPAFQEYCKENTIILTVSASSFRRNYLEKHGYIVPQYQMSSAGKARLDYRKVIDGIEAQVLNVSSKLLKKFNLRGSSNPPVAPSKAYQSEMPLAPRN